MEICYDGALVMPKNYAVVNEEEMTYVEGGGWSSYYGLEAIGQITAIAGCAVNSAVLAGSAAKLCGLLVSTSNPMGLLGGIAVALGIPVLVGLTGVQAAFTLMAAGYMISSYKKTKNFWASGFKANTYSVWTTTVCLGVSEL